MLEQLSQYSNQIALPIIFKDLFYHQVLSSVTFHSNYLFQTMMKITVTYLFPIHNGRDEFVTKQEFSTFQFTLKCVRYISKLLRNLTLCST